MTCRRFLEASLGGAGLLAFAPRLALEAEALPVPVARAASAVDRVTLGRTGVQCSFLAQGTGFNGWSRQSAHTRMGQEAFTRLLRHGIDEGLDFVDMADLSPQWVGQG